MTFQVTHRTTYAYESPVSSSYGEVHLLPRDMPGQTVRSAVLTVDPMPGELRERLDYFGNRTHFFSLSEGHTKLEITATSLVDVSDRGLAGRLHVDVPWERVRDLLAKPTVLSDEILDAGEMVLDSPQAPASAAAVAYGQPSFRPGRPLIEAVVDLSHRINTEFGFRPGATTVGTPVDHVLGRRVGVCQDFAHLTVAVLRSFGLAARYVSGYLETDPPPGKPKLVGADVSHAWASFWVPEVGWVDVDPTNDQLVGDRYITTGWGRDYGDVAPLKGVIFTDGETEGLKVSVDVRRVGPSGSAQQSQTVDGVQRMSQQQQQQQQTWHLPWEL